MKTFLNTSATGVKIFRILYCIFKFCSIFVSRLRLRYSAVFDMYFRDWEDDLDPNTTNVKHGWKNTVFSFDGVERIDDNKNGKVSTGGNFYCHFYIVARPSPFYKLC